MDNIIVNQSSLELNSNMEEYVKNSNGEHII